MSECLQAYVGLDYMCLVGLPLPHSGTERRQWRGNYFWTGGEGQERGHKERVLVKFGPYFLSQNPKIRSSPNFDLVFCHRKQCSPKKGFRRISSALFGSKNSSQGRGQNISRGHVSPLPPTSRAYECRAVSLEQSNSVLQQWRPTCLSYRYVYWQSRQNRPSLFRPILISRYHRNLLHNIGLSFFNLTWLLLLSLPRPNLKHANSLQMINFVLFRKHVWDEIYIADFTKNFMDRIDQN